MTPQEKASEFVKRFPLLFDNPIDHEHWIEHLTELIESGNEPKHTPEQQAYLDQCAIAAMQGLLASETERSSIGAPIDKAYTDYLTTSSFNIAEAMLAEREKIKLS